MDMNFPDLTADLAEKAMTAGTVTPEGVLALRHIVWGEGDLSREKIEAILAINLGVDAPGPEWSEFLVEAITVWLVDRAQPEGYVDETAAQWLVGHLAAANRPASTAELELLVKIDEKAVKTPACLRDFALGAFDSAVTHAGHVDAKMAQRLRRLIFAEGSDEPGHVSAREADLLFRLKDGTVASPDNAPEWKQLFVQGVGNYLQGCHNFAAPVAGREAELEAFMNRKEPSTLGDLEEMEHSLPQAVGMAYGIVRHPIAGQNEDPTLRAEHLGRDQDSVKTIGERLWDRFVVPDDELLGHDLESEAKADTAMTGDKTGWLGSELHGGTAHDEYEAALLEFLRQG